MNKVKTTIQNLKFYLLTCSFTFCVFGFALNCYAQQSDEIEFTLDATSSTIPLPMIFKPNIDLSGRGFSHEASWPQTLAAPEVLDIWQKEIGFNGIYRLEYNLWEIDELKKDKPLQDKLLANYESIFQKITDAGGVIILNIFSAPAGMGRVLDRKSPPVDLRAFKEIIKSDIRTLSCEKKYNIWYEVWSAPDLDDFFLGRRQEYLNTYRVIGEAIKELQQETKVYIPLGGPAVSWWFRSLDNNTIVTPEKSLVYDLIKFCFRYHLPLNFISWHSYSTDPRVDREATRYNKTAIKLIRDWLSYFNFDRNTLLIVDEWNYDQQTNILPARHEQSYIAASYIPARIKNMHEAGLDYQLYFSLEDFQDNKEGVVRNVGIFWVDREASKYKGGNKAIYNVFKMLNQLGNNLYAQPKLNDEFAGVIATKSEGAFIILAYNYIDPDIAKNYISRGIAGLNDGERKVLLRFAKTDKLEKIIRKELDTSGLRLTNRLKGLLNKAQELHAQAEKYKISARNIKMEIKNLKGDYLYRRYTIDSSCSIGCDFTPAEEKEISGKESYAEPLKLSPYSVSLIILEKKPAQPGDSEPKAQNNNG